MVRLLLPQQLIFYRPDIYREDERVGWRFAADLDTRVNTGERDVHLRTDHHGHRIGEDDPEETEYAILAVGDSFVAALQVDHAERMTTLLAEDLSEDLGATVRFVADGVAGWGPTQYALEIERELDRADYALVVVFLFMGNDVEVRREGRFDFEEIRQQTVRELRWPREWSWDELVQSWLVPLDDALDVRSHFYVLVKRRLDALRIRLGLSPVFIPHSVMRSRAGGREWAGTAELAAEITALAAARGVPVLFVLLPANYQVDRALLDSHVRLMGVDPESVDVDQPSRLLIAEFESRGLDVVDATAALRRAYAAGGPELYGKIDVHFEPRGHRVVADFLRPILRKRLTSRD